MSRLPVAIRLFILVAAALAFGGWLFTRPPMPQDVAYHRFADQRTLLGVPHGLNVLSNGPFAVVGALALWFLLRGRTEGIQGPAEHWAYLLLFSGVGLTAFGSAYYHLHPDNNRLVWDRLPMSVAFMSLFAAILAERVSPRLGLALLPVLIAAGIGSVLYWHMTEERGRGDLRFYYLVQFFPLLALPLIVLLFPARYTHTADLFLALGCYVLAKVCEDPLDLPIFDLGHWVSGHTLKHLLAALGAFCILLMIWRRRLRNAPNGDHAIAGSSNEGA